MADDRRLRAGRMLRQLRQQKYRLDGRSWSQADLANKAGISEKTVRTVEREGKATKYTLDKMFKALDINDEIRRELEDGFNPLRTERPPLDSVARLEMKGQIREALKGPSSSPRFYPSFMVDEYWFIRAMNIYVLALHEVKADWLHLPETWHNIAIKFHPEIDMRKIRGPNWVDYYMIVIKKFRNEMTKLEGTERYQKMTKWLKSFRGTCPKSFTYFWKKANHEVILFEVKARVFNNIPVYVGGEVSYWEEFGGHYPVSPYVTEPGYYRALWEPKSSQQINLKQKARDLGYTPNDPYKFIENYLSEAQLREIGGWVE